MTYKEGDEIYAMVTCFEFERVNIPKRFKATPVQKMLKGEFKDSESLTSYNSYVSVKNISIYFIQMVLIGNEKDLVAIRTQIAPLKEKLDELEGVRKKLN